MEKWKMPFSEWPYEVWEVFKFTKPSKLEYLGEVSARHSPEAYLLAAKRWPELARPEWPKYKLGRLQIIHKKESAAAKDTYKNVLTVLQILADAKRHNLKYADDFIELASKDVGIYTQIVMCASNYENLRKKIIETIIKGFIQNE